MLPIEPREQTHIPHVPERKSLLTKCFSYSRDIIPAVPPAINSSYVGPNIILGTACSLKAIFSGVFPALNSTLMDSCVTLGSLAFYETLSFINKLEPNEIQENLIPPAERLINAEAPVDYAKRIINYVQPFETRGSPIQTRRTDERFNVQVGSKNTVDEVCYWAAEMDRCDPIEIIIRIDQMTFNICLTLEHYAKKTIEEAYAAEYQKVCSQRFTDIKHRGMEEAAAELGKMYCLSIDVELKKSMDAQSSIEPRGPHFEISGMRHPQNIGIYNTLEEICKEIAIQRGCHPEAVVLETWFLPEKWAYFGLEEIKEKHNERFCDIAFEKYGMTLEPDSRNRYYFRVRILYPLAIKCARSSITTSTDE
ncbi:MAG: hypothetical protein Q8K75_12415 [Chlamydiales bacterium]|nr:hypothetical protein [Chlamydiales bacterium]